MLHHRQSGVVVLSPEESDIGSPRSPESGCSSGSAEEGGARMPPWASEPAPARRLAVQPAPTRRPAQPAPRRITEFFNHRMKPHQGLKRDHGGPMHNDDSKKKCLPKNGVTQDLEKYISYLSQTLSPKVLKDVGRQAEAATGQKSATSTVTGAFQPHSRPAILTKKPSSAVVNGMMEFGKPKSGFDRVHTTMNGFMEVRQQEPCSKDKLPNVHINGLVDSKKRGLDVKNVDSSANGIRKHAKSAPKGKVPIPALPSAPVSRSPIKLAAKPDNSRMNGVVSSTTKLDSKMNGVMCGSNNLSLNSTHKSTTLKRESSKKSDTPPSKRTNRKSSACIANSKNLTWSKANNLKQVQLQQKQNRANATPSSSASNIPAEVSSTPKLAVPNGVRQVSMTVNGNMANINMPVTNLQNCHQINIPQPCNGTVSSNNLTSFVAVPHNVMLTTLRIPQNGLPAQTLTHQNNINNMTTFNRPNVNVSSPTKLNGQFVFPLMQNINGTVVQIPNLMAKMPNFVLPQTPQIPQRQDHLQSPQHTTQIQQHTAQILFNGTLLKLANTMPPYQNVNKTTPMTSQPVPPMNKNLPGVPTVGMTVQPKPNYAVNFSHPMLMPQTGFIVTSVPNMNVKETWSYSGSTVTTAPSSCANPIVNHPPPLLSFTNQALHPSSIPIAPVKPPDNPIQGTDPPSSTVKEPDTIEVTTSKCDIPWLSKTVNNNIVPLESLESSKINERPFSQVSSTLSEKIEQLVTEKVMEEKALEKKSSMEILEDDPITEDMDSIDSQSPEESEELRKVEEVARREETIFTQITVLKDVSSNVHSTVIDTNFVAETTESDSGIGTDKSIDSPSDSQASKECDDDSSLSLSISMCSMDVPSQKSPILKQPKTLRFPPRNPTKAESSGRRSSSYTSTVSVCLWENCNKEFEGDPDLLEHLQCAHVESQVDKETYVCLWQQCKVRGKPSCSRHWLEKHTLAHGGNKPFKCIFDGCERRFSTQTLLERHLNHHFNESPGTGSGKKTADSSSKLIRRNGKKLRYRRQPWSARMFDYFDRGIMEGLAWRLWRTTRWRLGGGCPLAEPRGRHTLTLHAALQATRYNPQERRREALVTYYPPHVLEDEWVPEKEVTRIKRVEIANLPVHTKVMLYEQFCLTYRRETLPRPKPKPAPVAPPRVLPSRNCASSRVLNNLIAKQRKSIEVKPVCDADNLPLLLAEEECRVEVTGAKKRKMGRRCGGNSFWPCGR